MRYKGIKNKVWEEVKKSIRRREKDCYTCPNTDLEGKNAQAGHYRPTAIVGANNTRNWLPQVIHLQCSRCNGPGQGEQVVYRKHLVEDYGEEWVAQYDAEFASKKPSPVTDWDAVIHTFRML